MPVIYSPEGLSVISITQNSLLAGSIPSKLKKNKQLKIEISPSESEEGGYLQANLW